jgi:hypothetical protein
LLEQIAQLLEELVAWTRVMAYPSVKEILETALDTDQKRLIYHLFDGTRTLRSIQQLTGVNTRFISEWGREWEKIGIVESEAMSGGKGRRRGLFDLSTFGITIPESLGEKKGENDERVY